jgi:hypothetical protein
LHVLALVDLLFAGQAVAQEVCLLYQPPCHYNNHHNFCFESRNETVFPTLVLATGVASLEGFMFWLIRALPTSDDA